MKLFRLLWKVHRWVGITLAVFALIAGTTGVFLLLKKRIDWIQPPTRKDVVEGTADEFMSIGKLCDIVFSQGYPEFKSPEDLDRIDLRPGERVYKVHSIHGHMEVQVGAISGNVLSYAKRWSDWFEDIHDGSWIGDWLHDYVMIGFAIGVPTLAITGLYIWLSPKWRRRKKKRARKGGAPA